MRGAWLWPSFVVLTAGDGFLLSELPFYDEGPGGVVAGILVAGFANLAAVALVAPLLARWLRRRREDLPRGVAVDYAGCALIWLMAAGFLLGGLLHRPAVQAREREEAGLVAAVERYVHTAAPEREAFLARTDWLRLADHLYRACVPGHDPRRSLCLFVETDQTPAGVRRDPDQTPNHAY